MATEFFHILTETITVGVADVAEHIAIKADGAVAGANEAGIGLTTMAAKAGEPVPVAVLGIAIGTSGGAISVGDKLTTDANGKLVAAAAVSVTVPAGATAVTSDAAQPDLVEAGGVLPQRILGEALSAASGADEKIRVLLKN